MQRIFLDHASTTPVAPGVLTAMLPYLGERFGNPSGPHGRGAAAREAVERARADVAALGGAAAEEIVFTGSATEANNLALKGLVQAAGGRSLHLAAASTEHISVLHPLRTLEKRGCRVSRLPVDGRGSIDPDDVARVIAPDTILISVAHASGEIGTLQPLAEICRVARDRGVPVHCDATLTAGVIPWPSGDEGPDLVTVTPHLFYGPQGVGALRVRRGLRLAPLVEGGGQEGGLRAGTEPLAAIVGFGAAARLAVEERAGRALRSSARAARLRLLLQERLAGAVFTGHPAHRIPGHLSLCVRGTEAEALLTAL
ncbi:MAG TPA: aminotransferase class V-fold PLP-dependent enzyme, partial [Candidatus Polarisedimenticolia bacterium]|nr:aminotransferase class V-fold PLP-dependent enzyme [Candidatus Polarisedimenticolia bacterium]